MDRSIRNQWRGWSDQGLRHADKSALYQHMIELDEYVNELEEKPNELIQDLRRLFDEVLMNHMPLVRSEQEICDEINEKWGIGSTP